MGADPIGRAVKSCVCGRALAEIAGSNPAEGHAYSSLVFAVCCLASGHCDELINRLEQRFTNCGPRTTSGPRVLPLWSF